MKTKTLHLLLFFALSAIFVSFSNLLGTGIVNLFDKQWQAVNSTHVTYVDGTEMVQAKTKEEWTSAAQQGIGAWCYYDFKVEHADMGKFYNAYALQNTKGFALKGWHVPSQKEWKTLANALGKQTAGEKLKSSTGWADGQNGTNETGMGLQPLGFVNAMGEFIDHGKVAYVWTSTPGSGNAHNGCVFYGQSKTMGQVPLMKSCGLPVRLVKD